MQALPIPIEAACLKNTYYQYTKMANLQITAPRELTTTDTYQLRYMFKEQLQITNNSSDDDKQDADDIIDYALDMVEDGKTVGTIVEEVSSCMICAYVKCI